MHSMEFRQEVRQYLDSGYFDGAGIRVAVFDSGISRAHPDMRNVVVKSLDFRGDKNGEESLGNLDPSGHGTAVASIIAGQPRKCQIDGQEYTISGLAPGTQIYDVKVIPDDQKKIDYSVSDASKRALKWCLDQPVETRPHIVVMCYGAPEIDPNDPKDEKKSLDEYTDFEKFSRRYLIGRLIQEGVFIFLR